MAAGRRGRHGTAAVVPQPSSSKAGGDANFDTFPTAAFPVSNRSASDTSQWDFRRREAQMHNRSAREWVRDSNVEEPASDWSTGLNKYDPDSAAAIGTPSLSTMIALPRLVGQFNVSTGCVRKVTTL
jgi:hypothetical protein